MPNQIDIEYPQNLPDALQALLLGSDQRNELIFKEITFKYCTPGNYKE